MLVTCLFRGYMYRMFRYEHASVAVQQQPAGSCCHMECGGISMEVSVASSPKVNTYLDVI